LKADRLHDQNRELRGDTVELILQLLYSYEVL